MSFRGNALHGQVLLSKDIAEIGWFAQFCAGTRMCALWNKDDDDDDRYSEVV